MSRQCLHAMGANPTALHDQRGVAILVVAIILLVGVSLTVILGSRVAVLEQRMSANSERATQAANAAHAGLERALAYIRAGGAPGTCQFLATVTGATAALGLPTYWVRFYYPWQRNVSGTETIPRTRIAEPQCPASPPAAVDLTGCAAATGGSTRDLTILSCGWSDDRTALKYSIADLQAGPSLGGQGPTNPMISGSGVVFNGAARVYNLFSNLTIWSAGNLSLTGNPGNTYIRNPANPNLTDNPGQLIQYIADLPNSCGTHDSTDTYICTTRSRDLIGPDLIDNDNALAGLSDDAFFQGFMGVTPAYYRENLAAQVLTPTQFADREGSIDGQAIWVTGDARIQRETIGTRASPVILIVDGNLEMIGNPLIYGVVYVRGAMRAAGRPRVFGSAIVRGNAEGGGTPDFIYDPYVVSNAARLGARSIMSGSWHDWPED